MSETKVKAEDKAFNDEIVSLKKKYNNPQMFVCISDASKAEILDWLTKLKPVDYIGDHTQIEKDLKQRFNI